MKPAPSRNVAQPRPSDPPPPAHDTHESSRDRKTESHIRPTTPSQSFASIYLRGYGMEASPLKLYRPLPAPEPQTEEAGTRRGSYRRSRLLFHGAPIRQAPRQATWPRPPLRPRHSQLHLMGEPQTTHSNHTSVHWTQPGHLYPAPLVTRPSPRRARRPSLRPSAHWTWALLDTKRQCTESSLAPAPPSSLCSCHFVAGPLIPLSHQPHTRKYIQREDGIPGTLGARRISQPPCSMAMHLPKRTPRAFR